eukprot:m.470655 g.470655  ORF g.470655 m.470655 type:complete len:81 (-) comp30048_c0_seq1:462-704(-)
MQKSLLQRILSWSNRSQFRFFLYEQSANAPVHSEKSLVTDQSKRTLETRLDNLDALEFTHEIREEQLCPDHAIILLLDAI